MQAFIGRKKEIDIFDGALSSEKSEFIALYGRSWVGETFLVRYELKNGRKVIFIDELPWFDTRNSNFIQGLEHFWNSWASARYDILLIVCGSATSWMTNKLINNKGGLHNRITKKIRLKPFRLNECEELLKSPNIILDRYQIVQLYMSLGGIPYYWNEVGPGLSAMQNIDDICFSESGLLRNEFENLYRSLFKNYERHLSIVRALARRSKGMIRDELVKFSGLPNAGSTTRILDELEESGFIRKYIPFGRKSRNSLPEYGAQIDLIIDRRDQVINLCEMKFSINPFTISKKYASELRNKIGTFKTETQTRKSVFLTMITTFGVQKNLYSTGLIQNELQLDDLFISI